MVSHCLNLRITHLDVYSTVTKMNSQGMMMMVETPEQYLDIFQGLKDVLTIRDLSIDYIDLSPERLSYDDGRDDFNYHEDQDEGNYHTGGGGNYNQGSSFY